MGSTVERLGHGRRMLLRLGFVVLGFFLVGVSTSACGSGGGSSPPPTTATANLSARMAVPSSSYTADPVAKWKAHIRWELTPLTGGGPGSRTVDEDYESTATPSEPGWAYVYFGEEVGGLTPGEWRIEASSPGAVPWAARCEVELHAGVNRLNFRMRGTWDAGSTGCATGLAWPD